LLARPSRNPNFCRRLHTAAKVRLVRLATSCGRSDRSSLSSRVQVLTALGGRVPRFRWDSLILRRTEPGRLRPRVSCAPPQPPSWDASCPTFAAAIFARQAGQPVGASSYREAPASVVERICCALRCDYSPQVACDDHDWTADFTLDRLAAAYLVWCRYCEVWHEHGPAEGHRIAHCQQETPYSRSGYNLALAGGDWTEAFE
jgi:hypothetical protein